MSSRSEITTPSHFVVQEHCTPDGVHWDLMLQHEDTLWTWRMSCPPTAIGDIPLILDKIIDHPLRFLSYEGPVQNNTASVKIADCGTYESIERTEIFLRVVFCGRHIKGCFLLDKKDSCTWMLKHCP